MVKELGDSRSLRDSMHCVGKTPLGDTEGAQSHTTRTPDCRRGQCLRLMHLMARWVMCRIGYEEMTQNLTLSEEDAV